MEYLECLMHEKVIIAGWKEGIRGRGDWGKSLIQICEGYTHSLYKETTY